MADRYTPLVVPPHTQAEVLRLYSLIDERHRRIWSQAAIGKALGISETTVFRIVKRLGAYQQKLKTEDEVKAEAAASAARLLELLRQEPTAAPKEKPSEPDPLVPTDRLKGYG